MEGGNFVFCPPWLSQHPRQCLVHGRDSIGVRWVSEWTMIPFIMCQALESLSSANPLLSVGESNAWGPVTDQHSRHLWAPQYFCLWVWDSNPIFYWSISFRVVKKTLLLACGHLNLTLGEGVMYNTADKWAYQCQAGRRLREHPAPAWGHSTSSPSAVWIAEGLKKGWTAPEPSDRCSHDPHSQPWSCSLVVVGVSKWDASWHQTFLVGFVVCKVITPCAVGSWQRYLWTKTDNKAAVMLRDEAHWESEPPSCSLLLSKWMKPCWMETAPRKPRGEDGKSTRRVKVMTTLLATAERCAEHFEHIVPFNPSIACEGSYYHYFSDNETTCQN